MCVYECINKVPPMYSRVYIYICRYLPTYRKYHPHGVERERQREKESEMKYLKHTTEAPAAAFFSKNRRAANSIQSIGRTGSGGSATTRQQHTMMIIRSGPLFFL